MFDVTRIARIATASHYCSQKLTFLKNAVPMKAFKNAQVNYSLTIDANINFAIQEQRAPTLRPLSKKNISK